MKMKIISSHSMLITMIFILLSVLNFGCSKKDNNMVAILITQSATSISSNSVEIGGFISSDGGSAITDRGICFSFQPNPTIENFIKSAGLGTGSFQCSLDELMVNTSYYAKAYALNEIGVGYGNEVSFSTLSTILISTNMPSKITKTTAECGGVISYDGGATITERGICWSQNPNPELIDSHTFEGAGSGDFSSQMNNLEENTEYHVRAYATNVDGITYGEDYILKTLYIKPQVSVSDVNGNSYNTVKIGTQTWMSENLKVRNYRNGDTIQHLANNDEWRETSTGAYSWYNNDEATYDQVFGLLYNFYSVSDERGLCPTGWHVPTDYEWSILVEYLGGMDFAGGQMKETGTTLWENPNVEATNESGFSAIPGGERQPTGEFCVVNTFAGFWTSTPEQLTTSAYHYGLSNEVGKIYRFSYYKKSGKSVRCMKN